MRLLALIALSLAVACGGDDDGDGGGPADGGGDSMFDAPVASDWAAVPPLPRPVANNALAAVLDQDRCTLVTAGGIDTSRAWDGIIGAAYLWREGDGEWTALPDLPADPPRIAASAVALRGTVYVLGGYSVADNGNETTHNDVFALDLASGEWDGVNSMPESTDDAVAVAWRDRYIVVVSGWSDNAPIRDVQIFDADTGNWTLANDFPGIPVFGAAGAIWEDELLFVDGVRSNGGFSLVNQTWVGALDPEEPEVIAWTDLGAHPPPARYRAAAGALGGRFYLHGGTAEPYNFDGMSYDTSSASPPLASTVTREAGGDGWTAGPDKPVATMDHRALAGCGDALYTAGGMVAGPAVTDQAWALRP